MFKSALTGLVVLMFSMQACAEWEQSEFMITQWGRPKVQNDEAIAEAAAKAGNNHIMWTADKLDLCKKYGLKVIIEQPTPDSAKKVSGHPALWGYYCGDEPYPESTFIPLAETMKSLHSADPDHPSFVNMLSTTGDFLRTYMEIVKPELLSFDFYKWLWGSDRYYEKLEQFREAAMLGNVPLTTCIETSATPPAGPEYLPDNAEKLRQSVYTSLAYGVKGIQWYHGAGLYRPESTELSKSGKDISVLNGEMKNIGPILVKLRSMDVYHTTPLPKGTREAPKEHWIQLISEEGSEGLILGTFKEKSNKHYMDDVEEDYFMVANRDYRNSQHVVVRFQSKWLGIAPWNTPKKFTRAVEKFDKKTGKWVKISTSCAVGFIFYINPADGDFFKVTTTIENQDEQ